MSRSKMLDAGWKSKGASTRRYQHSGGASVFTDAMGMWIGMRPDGSRETFVNRDTAMRWATS